MEELAGSTTLRQKPVATAASTALEDVDADLSGDRVRSGDRAVLDYDLVLVRPPDAACVQRTTPPIDPNSSTAGTLSAVLPTSIPG